MVSPIDGKAHSGNRALTGSRWAERWEQEHGGIVIPTRVERNRLRDALAQRKTEFRERAAAEEARIRATIPPHEKDRLEAALSRVKATEQQRVQRTREAVRERMPATEPTRSNGGRSQLTAEDRAAWSRTHERQRRERKQLHRPTTRGGRRAHPERQAALARAQRAERCQMAREQRALRELRQVAAESLHVAPYSIRCWAALRARRHGAHRRAPSASATCAASSRPTRAAGAGSPGRLAAARSTP